MKIFSGLLLLIITFFNGHFAFAKDKAPKGPKITKEERIDDWFYRCIESTNKKTHCGLFQDVIGEDKKSKNKFPVLSLQIYDNPSTKKRIMTLRAPHGVFLPKGISYQIDGSKKDTIGFGTCLAEPLGCTASMELKPEIEKLLKKAKKITIEYQSFFSQKAVTIPLNGKGYSKAIKKL